MRFVLHTTALNGGDALQGLIDRLVDRVADEVHRVEVPQADLLQDSAWYRSARPTRQKIVMSAVAIPPRTNAHARGPHAKVTNVHDEINAREADKLAHTPLTLLVEDREADGVLLDILVEELGWPELRSLWTRGKEITPPAIEFENSAGINAMPQRVERIADDARIQDRPLRCFVLCDSDARWPNDCGHPSVHSIDDLRRRCEEHSIPLHVLQKRSAENYIPDAVFTALRADPAYKSKIGGLEAFLRLTPMQRDHFPVKDGLSDAERTLALGAGLYDAGDEPDLDKLKERLLPRRPRPLLLLSEERRASFSSEGLRCRDGNGEIDTLLEAIAREL